MPNPAIRDALSPSREELLSFVARKRERPARTPPPVIVQYHIYYRQWDGPPLPFAEDFGKKMGQVYSRDEGPPIRSCNEVEVAKRLRLSWNNAFWISSYNPSQIPSLWRPWTRSPREVPEWLSEIDDQIRRLTGRATGGTPDVVAWNDTASSESAVFVECKGASEDIKEGQQDWVSAALECSLSDSQFAVAIRQFR